MGHQHGSPGVVVKWREIARSRLAVGRSVHHLESLPLHPQRLPRSLGPWNTIQVLANQRLGLRAFLHCTTLL